MAGDKRWVTKTIERHGECVGRSVTAEHLLACCTLQVIGLLVDDVLPQRRRFAIAWRRKFGGPFVRIDVHAYVLLIPNTEFTLAENASHSERLAASDFLPLAVRR